MFNMALAIVSLFLCLFVVYIAIKISRNTKGSRLFQTSSILLMILSVLVGYFSLVNLNVLSHNNLINTIILNVFNIVFFKLWLTTYNQDNRTYYPMFVNLALILSFIVAIVESRLNYISPILSVLAKYNLINLGVMIVILSLFIKYRKLNKSRESIVSSIIYLGLVLTVIGLVVTDGYFQSVYVIITSILAVLLSQQYWSQVKKSSYY